jgi:hypothetical protein
MGHISNQWLGRGEGLRSRGYHPVPVSISCDTTNSSWSERNGAKVVFTARKGNGEYQTLYLSEAEAAKAAETLLAFLGAQARDRFLQKTLRGLSHAKLLRALAVDLRVRVRLPKDR